MPEKITKAKTGRPARVNSVFELYGVVELKRTIPEIPVPAGTTGTIVYVHDADPRGYLVEFPDALGPNGLDANGNDTLGVYPVREADLEAWKDTREQR